MDAGSFEPASGRGVVAGETGEGLAPLGHGIEGPQRDARTLFVGDTGCFGGRDAHGWIVAGCGVSGGLL